MINEHDLNCSTLRSFILAVSLAVCLLLQYLPGQAQKVEPPPRPIIVTTFQHMSFGSIYQGIGGGTVIMSPSGVRSRTGDIVLPSVGTAGNEAIFEVKAAPGALMNISFGSTKLWNGANFMNLVFDSWILSKSSCCV